MKSPIAQAAIFFIVFVVLTVLIQMILGNALTAGVILGQVIMAAIATVLFMLFMRWYQRRS